MLDASIDIRHHADASQIYVWRIGAHSERSHSRLEDRALIADHREMLNDLAAEGEKDEYVALRSDLTWDFHIWHDQIYCTVMARHCCPHCDGRDSYPSVDMITYAEDAATSMPAQLAAILPEIAIDIWRLIARYSERLPLLQCVDDADARRCEWDAHY